MSVQMEKNDAKLNREIQLQNFPSEINKRQFKKTQNM